MFCVTKFPILKLRRHANNNTLHPLRIQSLNINCVHNLYNIHDVSVEVIAYTHMYRLICKYQWRIHDFFGGECSGISS